MTIDVHAHVFNAADLPVDGFVRTVVFEHYERQATPIVGDFVGGNAVRALAELLGRILEGSTITAADELAELGLISDHIEKDNEVSSEERDHLIYALRSLQLMGDSPLAPDTTLAALSVGDISALFEVMRAEELRDAEATGREPRAFARAGTALADEPDRGFFAWINEVADFLISTPGEVARHVRWGLLLTRSRKRIVDRYISLYAANREVDGVRLFTPALIDYSRWLKDDEPRSPLADQVEVMEALQRRPGSIRMHCFVAFDPWRHASHVKNGGNLADSPFGLVQRAISEKGFMGVKLYPPMGFLPLGNAQANNLTYPARALDEFGRDFPKWLDEALRALYRWCEDEEAPIMAHAAASNAAGPEYAERACPERWRLVVKEFPGLRINLAHFGGFHTYFSERDRGKQEKTWEWMVGRLIEEHSDAHVYADLSYLSELLREEQEELRGDLTRLLRQFRKEFQRTRRRLMFGSDWIMLGREPNHVKAIERAKSLLEDADFTPSEIKHFMTSNALAFLGLDQQNRKGYLRLQSYYEKSGLNISLIDEMQ